MRPERGAALILVVVTISVLSILLGVVVERVSREVAGTKRFTDELQLRELARSGVRIGLDRLAADETPAFDGREESWLRPVVFRTHGCEVRATVADEGSKLNLNAMPAAVLARLPGVGPDELDRLLTFRRRWIEVPEELSAVDGWASLGPKLEGLLTTWGLVNPLGMPPDQLESLLRVRGVDEFTAKSISEEVAGVQRATPEEPPADLDALSRAVPSLGPGVLDRIREDLLLTGPVNANLASPEVLSCLWAGLNLKAESRQKLLQAREVVDFMEPAGVWQAMGDPDAAKALRPYLGVSSGVFLINSTAKLVSSDGQATPSVTQVGVKAIVRRDFPSPGERPKFTILSWSEVE